MVHIEFANVHIPVEIQATPPYFFRLEQKLLIVTLSCCVLGHKNTGTCTVYLMPKAP